MGILFRFLTEDYRPIPFFQPCAKVRSMCPPALPSVLTLGSCGNEILCMEWEEIWAFSKSLVCIIGQQYSRDPERTEFQTLKTFLKFSIGKSKLGNRESEQE